MFGDIAPVSTSLSRVKLWPQHPSVASGAQYHSIYRITSLFTVNNQAFFSVNHSWQEIPSCSGTTGNLCDDLTCHDVNSCHEKDMNWYCVCVCETLSTPPHNSRAEGKLRHHWQQVQTSYLEKCKMPSENILNIYYVCLPAELQGGGGRVSHVVHRVETVLGAILASVSGFSKQTWLGRTAVVTGNSADPSILISYPNNGDIQITTKCHSVAVRLEGFCNVAFIRCVSKARFFLPSCNVVDRSTHVCIFSREHTSGNWTLNLGSVSSMLKRLKTAILCLNKALWHKKRKESNYESAVRQFPGYS